MRFRLYHKPSNTVKAGAYLLDDAYTALTKMPPLDAGDYLVVKDEQPDAAIDQCIAAIDKLRGPDLREGNSILEGAMYTLEALKAKP